MKVYLYLFEDYIEFVFSIANELKARYPQNLEIIGLAARRKTVCQKIDSSGLPVKRYDWLGDLERKWLSQPLDRSRLASYEQRLGTETLRLLINCDRELAFGFIRGGIYARTKLRKIVESDDEYRWRYLVGMLDYFYETFQRERPDFIYFNEFTMAYELAAGVVAQDLGIQCFGGFVSRFSNLYLLTKSYRRDDTGVRDLLNSPEKIRPEFLEKSRAYLKTFRDRPEIPSYSSIQQKRILRVGQWHQMLKRLTLDLVKWVAIALGMKGTRGFLRQRSGWDLLCTNLRMFWTARKTLRGHIFENPEKYLLEPFIYFPLHVEPEATTLVEANKVANQLMVIEQIAKGMPLGHRLLVKEHIPMLGLRPADFYEKIRQMPDVHLITPFADGFRIMQKASVIVTITGTGGWESLLMKKPTVLIGEPEYSQVQSGFVYAENITQMEKYLRQAVEMPPISEERLVHFIAAYMQRSVELPVQTYAYAHYGGDGAALMAQHKGAISGLVDRMLEMRTESANP